MIYWRVTQNKLVKVFAEIDVRTAGFAMATCLGVAMWSFKKVKPGAVAIAIGIDSLTQRVVQDKLVKTKELLQEL